MLLEGIDILAETGYRSPIAEVQFTDKESICKLVSLHYGLLVVKAELDQLRTGLMTNSGHLMQIIQENPVEFQAFFHSDLDQSSPTAGICLVE